MNMARPPRPVAERRAVDEAALSMRSQFPSATPPMIAAELARLVVAELLLEIDGVNDDPLVAALRRATTSPVQTLATCPDIDTMSEFVERRISALRNRSGAYLTSAQQDAEKRCICASIERTLMRRDLRHLRSG
jgi:hypothetical protein